MRSLLIHTLDALHLGNTARSAQRAVKARLRQLKWVAKARLLWGWKPLVPEGEFTACCRNAIQTLQQLGSNRGVGDYLEFGVSRGTSLACMHRALESEGLSHVRLLGFDSFQGLPPEAANEGSVTWVPGAYKSSLAATRRYLSEKGVDWSRVTLIEGWFKDTLTPETKARLNIESAGLIMIDCDIYSASRDALWFCQPFIRDRAVIFLDDWGSNMGNIGQKEAFEEFLAEFPQLSAEPLPSYGPQARVFLITRRVA